MSLELTGKLHVKYDTQVVNDRLKKREFVVELSDEINGNIYTNYAKMQLAQSKCEILDKFAVGDEIKVSFNVKGNKWEKDGKTSYITNLDAWRVERVAENGNAAPANATQAANNSPENIDDLPF